MKVGNRWQVGIVKKIEEEEQRRKIEVVMKSTKEIYCFIEGTPHLARYHSFTQDKHFHFEDVFEGWSPRGPSRFRTILSQDLSFLRFEFRRLADVINLEEQVEENDELWSREYAGSRRNWVSPASEERQENRREEDRRQDNRIEDNIQVSVTFFDELNLFSDANEDEPQQSQLDR